VVFGSDIRLRPPKFFYAGDSILVKAIDDETLQVSCFRPGKEDRFEQSTMQLDSLIRAIAAVGGSYGELFEGLRSAKAQGVLPVRIEVDAIPTADRRYERPADEPEDETPDIHVAHPVPEMFLDRPDSSSDSANPEEEQPADEEFTLPTEETTGSSLLDRMTPWKKK
jgi:hypothetical protein